MNSVHDMGGMQGFGPVVPEANEPVFHAEWEAKVFALSSMMRGWRRWSLDAYRHSIERLPPATYLSLSYYEKWLEGLVVLSLGSGLVTPEEVATGRRDQRVPVATPPVTGDNVAGLLAAGGPSHRNVEVKPRFVAGDAVRARNIHPEGHTRLPRYVRGHTGTILRGHGAHVFPDSNARFAGEAPQPLYTVCFTAQEVWGESANPADRVYLDLWEDYLEPA